MRISKKCHCPICGVPNLTWNKIEALARKFKVEVDSITPRGHVYEIGPHKVTCGTACWDSSFGDECGACLNTVINTRKALIGPMGMCH